jgi:hypothetical protein
MKTFFDTLSEQSLHAVTRRQFFGGRDWHRLLALASF